MTEPGESGRPDLLTIGLLVFFAALLVLVAVLVGAPLVLG